MDDKYEQWLKGIEAAQNDLANSAENLYSILNADFLAGAYRSAAKLVDVFAGATDALNGWNLIIPSIAAGLLGLIGALAKINKLIISMGAAKGAISKLSAFTSGGGIGLAIGGIATIATIFGAFISGIETSEDRIEEYTKRIEE